MLLTSDKFMKLTKYAVIVFVFTGSLSFGLIDHGVQHWQKTVQTKDTVYTFQKDIAPLLQSNCKPCHFPGGKVYKKLPFDDYKTVASLGKKLNTRLKDKQQQAIVNGWLEFGKSKND